MVHKNEINTPAKFTKHNIEMKTKVHLSLEILSGLSPTKFKKMYSDFSPVEGEIVLKNKDGQIAVFDFNKNWVTKVETLEEENQ
ncbi:hypothetical protein MHB48_15240 [Psychrobacillus sp. FSL H8-0483]|uniref:hypothetical protein n=1 Tax=Psychrobacillus sp. FSL H8-0483 TaxID=2921389 RepID=UPI003159C079